MKSIVRLCFIIRDTDVYTTSVAARHVPKKPLKLKRTSTAVARTYQAAEEDVVVRCN